MNLRSIESEPLSICEKGLATAAAGHSINELRGLGLNVLAGDLPWPVAVLKDSALIHNAAWMRGFAERAGVDLCPHGKTTMAPQLFHRQLTNGAWGITAATATHVRTYRHFGVPRILLANQIIGRADIELIIDELRRDRDFDFYALVDSEAGLRLLVNALRESNIGRPLQLLLEVGAIGGRTGVRELGQGIALGRLVRNAAPWVTLRGIEAFEGVFGGKGHEQDEPGVRSMLKMLADLAVCGCQENWFGDGELIVSAGGSAYFDIAAAVLAAVPANRPMRAVLRSGCYLSHDSLHYERMQPRMRQRSSALWDHGHGLRAALEVWSCVQSIPEPARAICALGKRDISHDLELPQPLWWLRPGLHAQPIAAPRNLRVTALNDQHAFIDAVNNETIPWAVGDLVGFGVAHPCTTFDKWSLLHLVDDDYRVIGAIRTFF
jgi:D-serine dehydratase